MNNATHISDTCSGGNKGAAASPSRTAALILLGAVLSGCAGHGGGGHGRAERRDIRNSPYYPTSLSIVGSLTHDDHTGWDRQTIGAGLTWGLKPSAFAGPSPQPTAARTVVVSP